MNRLRAARALAVALLAFVLVMMTASSTGDDPTSPPVTPATAGPAVEFTP